MIVAVLKRLGLLALVCVLSGCATPPPKGQSVGSILAGKRVVVDAVMLRSDIDYGTERLMYAVMHKADFGSVWNPNEGLADQLAEQFVANGVAARSATASLNVAQRESWRADALAELSRVERETPAWNRAFIAGSPRKVARLREQAEPADLLFELAITRLDAMAPAILSARLWGSAYVRVTDVATGAVVFTGRIRTLEDVRLDGESIKVALERNNLKIIKEFVGRMVQMTPRVHFFPAAEHPFLVYDTRAPQHW